MLFFYFYNCNKIIITRDYTYVENIPASFYSKKDKSLADKALKYDESSFIKLEYLNAYQNNKGVISIGNPSMKYEGKKATVNGYIRDTVNNMPVVGAVIFFNDLESATVTDAKGFYTLRIEKGTHSMHIKSVGKKEKTLKVDIFSDR